MSITLTELITEARIHLADAQCSQSEFFEDADLTQYINNALLTLWSLLPPDILRNYEDLDEQNLVDGTANYDLPALFYMELAVMYNGVAARKIKYSEQKIIENNTYLQPLASQPGYTINDDDVYLFPTPSANATDGLGLFFLTKPPVLATGTDEVNIDIAYKPIVAKLASGRALNLKESVAEGKVLIQSALEDLKLMSGKDAKEEVE